MERVKTEGLTLAYREFGAGPPVLLLHGWPTSSYLWRGVMPAIARHNRVIALDLPGFGESDKPVDVRYTFDFFSRAIDGFLGELGIDRVALGGHDLGGPIAMHWAMHRPGRVEGIALLNTLLYPEFHESVGEFVAALSTPGRREELTSAKGLTQLFRAGLVDSTRATGEVLGALVAPFRDDSSRLALAMAGIQLGRRGFTEIAQGLPTLETPLRIVYGEQDRILPDMAETVARVRRDVPHAAVTPLADCGHFLQEEAPDEIGGLLAAFFASLR